MVGRRRCLARDLEPRSPGAATEVTAAGSGPEQSGGAPASVAAGPRAPLERACRAILANADSPALRHVYADGKGTFAGVSVTPEQYAALKAAVENTAS